MLTHPRRIRQTATDRFPIPIHVFARMDNLKAVSVFLDGRHHLAELRDAKGGTFLHVALQEESQSVVKYGCKLRSQQVQSSVMNMQDDDGNTAVHLAVGLGNLRMLSALMKNRLVELSLTNNKGQTPLDLSWIITPKGVRYGVNPRIMIHKLLQDAGAQNGTFRCDLFHHEHISRLDEEEEVQKINTSTQTIGIGSALIATVAFTAAFTLPGGLRADDNGNGGTPMLVGHPAFHVFIIANTLVFILSFLSLSMLMYAGINSIDIRSRMMSIVFAAILMSGSAQSLQAAFAFGLYVVLAPLARTTAAASFAIVALLFVEAFRIISKVCTKELVLLKRLGARAWWRLAWVFLSSLCWQFWPYILIKNVH